MRLGGRGTSLSAAYDLGLDLLRIKQPVPH